MQNIRSIAAVLLASIAWAAPFAEAQDKKASVAITAPANGAVLTSAVADVDVAFASGQEGKNDNQHILALELRVGSQTVATYDVPDAMRDGTHRFPAMALASFVQADGSVTLVARAQLAERGNRHADSDPVRVIVQSGVDAVPPTISNLGPALNTATSNARPLISAQIADTGGSGLDPVSIVLRLDGAAVAATLTMNGANAAGVAFTPAVDLSGGLHTFTVDAKDLAGNAAVQASSSFLVDLTPPVIANVLPANGASFANPPSVSATVTDSGGSGLNPSDISLVLNGILVPAVVTPNGPNAATLSFTPLGPLADGPHAVLIQATDRAGGAALPAQTVFFIDSLPPAIVISSPADGSILPGTAVPINALISDSGTGISVGSIQVFLNGANITPSLGIVPSSPTPAGAPGLVTVSGTSAGVSGPNFLVVQASDLVGHGMAASSSFTVQSATPPLSVFPNYVVDVQKVSAEPLVFEDLPPAAGMDAQTWTSRALKVKVRLTYGGEPQEGVPIVPTLTSGEGRFYFTNQLPRVSDADGNAGFLFVCPRSPGQVTVSVRADVLHPGGTAEFAFKALQIDPHLVFVGGYPDEGATASISGPTGMGVTTVILDEVDSQGNVVLDPSAQKLTIFSRVNNTKSSGIANLPLIIKSGATGVIFLRASYPEFEDDQGRLMSVTDSFNLSAFLAAGAVRSAKSVSGNGQILYPGRALDQPIVVQNLLSPDSTHPFRTVSVSIQQNVTQRGPDFPGMVEPVDGALVSSDQAKKSFTAKTNSDGTLSVRYTADPGSVTGVVLIVQGGLMTSTGGLSPGDPETVVVREPEFNYVADGATPGVQGQLEGLPLSPLDAILGQGLPSGGSYHIEVKVPRSGVGTDNPAILAESLQPDLAPVAADLDFPPPSKSVPLQYQGEDTFTSGSILCTSDRKFLGSVPSPSFEVLFAGELQRLTMLFQGNGQNQPPKQQAQLPPYLSAKYTPALPEKGDFKNGFVNNKINVIEAAPNVKATTITIDLGLKPPLAKDKAKPVQLKGETDAASGAPIGTFKVNGNAVTDPFTIAATPAPKSLVYELDPTKIPAGSNSVDRVLKFQLLNSTAKVDEVTVTVPIRLSRYHTPIKIALYYLQTNAGDDPTVPKNAPRFGQADRHMRYANMIWAQNGISFQELARKPVPNANPLPLFPKYPVIPADTLNWVDGSAQGFVKDLMTQEAGTGAALFGLFNDSISATNPVTGNVENLLGLVPNVAPLGAVGPALAPSKPNYILLEKLMLIPGGGVPDVSDAQLAHEIGHCLGLYDAPVANASLNNLMRQAPRDSNLLEGPNFATIVGAQDQFARSLELWNVLK